MSGGLSRRRRGRLHDVLAAHIERGELPGAVTAVARRGELEIDAVGTLALGGGAPMRRDTIFRISSMTKPVVAVAALILVEECRLRLDEPAERLLPELAGRRVLRRIDGPVDDTVPAARPITLRDLLTFRLGFGQLPGAPPTTPILRAAAELGLTGLGPPKPASPHPPDEWLRRFAALPLMCQPGERWLYNTGSYVLGVLVARAAGQPLETFLRERIFAPLGMKDTGFSVPPEKRARFATSYLPGPTGALELYDDPQTGQWTQPPVFPDGGAGLVSTVDDFLAFGQMLLAKGRLGGERILARTTVEAMITDQLTPAQKAISGFYPGHFDARGWGFGVAIVTARDDLAASPGRFGWDGGLGTSWASDPAEDAVAVLMTQRGGFPQRSNVYLDFWTSVYQALDD